MNSAQRLLQILDHLCQHQGKSTGTVGDVWAKTLRLKVAGAAELEDAVTLAIQAVRAEVDRVAADLAARGVSEGLYVSQLKRLKDVASPVRLRTEWRGVVGNINPPDVRLALGWAAAYLPDDEETVPAAEATAWAAEFEELEAMAKAKDLPPAVSDYVMKQLRVLRAALGMYDVRGVAALHDGLEQAAGAALKARASIPAEVIDAAPASRTVLQRMNAAVMRMAKTCDLADKLHKGGTAAVELAKAAQIAYEVASGGAPT